MKYIDDDREDYICLLEELVTEARHLRRFISNDDHWCMSKACQKCKTRESFDLALAELDKFQGR